MSPVPAARRPRELSETEAPRIGDDPHSGQQLRFRNTVHGILVPDFRFSAFDSLVPTPNDRP